MRAIAIRQISNGKGYRNRGGFHRLELTFRSCPFQPNTYSLLNDTIFPSLLRLLKLQFMFYETRQYLVGK